MTKAKPTAIFIMKSPLLQSLRWKPIRVRQCGRSPRGDHFSTRWKATMSLLVRSTLGVCDVK